MNLSSISPPHFHTPPRMAARHLLRRPAFLLVAGCVLLLLCQVAPVLADGSADVCYVAHFGPLDGRGDVRAYTLTETGALHPRQDPVEAGKRPRRILLSPNRQFAYVIDNKAFELLAYAIDPYGQLTQLPAGIIAPWVLSQTGAMAFHRPTGQKLYIPEYIKSTCAPLCDLPRSWVSVYGVESNGIVSPETEEKSGQIPRYVDSTPDGKHFFVATYGTSRVCSYTTDERTGAVTDIPGCVNTEPYPEVVKVDPTGRFAWVGSRGGHTQPGRLTAFEITPSGGLNRIDGVSAGDDPREIAFNALGTYGILLDHDGTMRLYRMLSTGAPQLHTTIQTGFPAWTVAFSPSDRFVLLPSIDRGIVSAYEFDAPTGRLAWRVDSPVGTGPISLACTADPQLPSFPISSGLILEWNPGAFSGEVQIALSRDGGNMWAILFPNTQNDGVQEWKITGPATTQASLKICGHSTQSPCATTENFAIH